MPDTQKQFMQTSSQKNDQGRKGIQERNRYVLQGDRHHKHTENTANGKELHLDVINSTLAISAATPEKTSYLDWLRNGRNHRC